MSDAWWLLVTLDDSCNWVPEFLNFFFEKVKTLFNTVSIMVDILLNIYFLLDPKIKFDKFSCIWWNQHQINRFVEDQHQAKDQEIHQDQTEVLPETKVDRSTWSPGQSGPVSAQRRRHKCSKLCLIQEPLTSKHNYTLRCVILANHIKNTVPHTNTRYCVNKFSKFGSSKILSCPGGVCTTLQLQLSA